MKSNDSDELTLEELEEVLQAAHDAVKPTSRFRLFGVTQRDIDKAHAETRALILAHRKSTAGS